MARICFHTLDAPAGIGKDLAVAFQASTDAFGPKPAR